jgi:hypothetical protein
LAESEQSIPTPILDSLAKELQTTKNRAPRIRGIGKTVKLTFWLDADVYEKLQSLKAKHHHLRYADILVDAVHQHVKSHGSAAFEPRRRFSVSLPRNLALVLRYGRVKLHVSERDMVNLAIREYRLEESARFRE